MNALPVPQTPCPKRQQGAETAESLITMVMFFVVFFIILDFAIAMYDRGAMVNASRFGTRQASLFWNDPAVFDPATPLQNRQVKRSMVDSFVTYVENNLLIRPTKSSLTTNFEINATPVTVAAPVVRAADVVSVEVTYPHEFIGLSLVSLSGISIGSSSSLVVE